MTIEIKVSTQAETDEDDAATLRDAADVLRRQKIDVPDALAVLDMVADMLDGPIEDEGAPDLAAVWDQAVEAVAVELETMMHNTWNGNQRRPSNYRAAAADARRTPNPYRKADQ